jgi:hypothetical protein
MSSASEGAEENEREEDKEDDEETGSSERSPDTVVNNGNREASSSPYSEMAVSNCLKSLSRLKFNDDAMLVSRQIYPLTPFIKGC